VEFLDTTKKNSVSVNTGNLSSKYQLHTKHVSLTKMTPELCCTR